MRILIVDDEQVASTSARRVLKRRGLPDVEICDNGDDAVARLKERDYDVVLLDLIMPGMDGLQVLECAKPHSSSTEFIILTAVDDVSTAVRAIRLGAYDYLVKPVDNERLVLTIERAYERKALAAGLAGAGSCLHSPRAMEAFGDIITENPRMKEVLGYAEIMARSGNPVLITGETGTGKELVARGIHRAGPTPDGPFVAVNIASIPETLFESQLFGHVKGAFTGAERDYVGYFEQADGGTLFMDEIGELPLNLQVKMLRVLEEKLVLRLGSTKPIRADVRVVSATNKDLDSSCREGRFRLDLLYRLKYAHVHLPPLRERQGDIPLLASHFLAAACKRHNRSVRGFSPEAHDLLSRMSFPGNIRQLAQVVENGVLLADAPFIQPGHLGLTQPSHLGVTQPPATFSFSRGLCTLRENDEIHVAYVLDHAAGDRKQAARILGITVRQLQRKLAQMRETGTSTKQNDNS